MAIYNTIYNMKEPEELEGYPGDVSEVAWVDNVGGVNHKPHQFMIGPSHIVHASKYHGGMLDEATLEALPCAAPGCRRPFKEHTFDTVAFVKQKRDCTSDEMQTFLKSMVEWAEQHKIDGFVFVEHKGYKII